MTALGFRVHQLNETPYADFAVWTPFSANVTKAQKFTTYLPQPDGTWLTKEVPGPSDFEAWAFCWKVFRAAAIMLEISAEVALSKYLWRIEKLNRQWPECWHLLFLAVVKYRKDHRLRILGRIMSDIARGIAAPRMWDIAKPWSVYFLIAAKKDGAFWDENVRHLAVS